MKKTLLFLFMLFSFACKKMTILENSKVNQADANAKQLFSATPISSSSLYRGIYLDSTSSIIGDTVKENNVLKWCKANGITTITYYDLTGIMTSGRANHLANFLKRARTGYGIKENSAAVGGDSYVTSVIDTFNNARVDTLKRFNWCHLESEWWNGDETFTSYITKLANIKAWGLSQTPKVRTEEYIGWFNNPSGQDSLVATALIQNSHRILVHDYYPTPEWNYMKDRVDYLGRAAYALGRTIPIVPIFYAGTYEGSSTNYFTLNSFDSSYQTIIDGYNSSTQPKKANVDVIGYQLFNYSEAKKARPIGFVNLDVNTTPSKPMSGQVRIYDNTGKLMDTQTFAANTANHKPLRQPSSWRIEIDVTSTASTRYIMEVYVDGVYLDYFFISPNTTRTLMKIPYPSGLHSLSGNVGLAFYPG